VRRTIWKTLIMVVVALALLALILPQRGSPQGARTEALVTCSFAARRFPSDRSPPVVCTSSGWELCEGILVRAIESARERVIVQGRPDRSIMAALTRVPPGVTVRMLYRADLGVLVADDLVAVGPPSLIGEGTLIVRDRTLASLYESLILSAGP